MRIWRGEAKTAASEREVTRSGSSAKMTRVQTITGPGPDRHALSILYECGCRECRRVMTYIAEVGAAKGSATLTCQNDPST
jgi:hypothetical protein